MIDLIWSYLYQITDREWKSVQRKVHVLSRLYKKDAEFMSACKRVRLWKRITKKETELEETLKKLVTLRKKRAKNVVGVFYETPLYTCTKYKVWGITDHGRVLLEYSRYSLPGVYRWYKEVFGTWCSILR